MHPDPQPPPAPPASGQAQPRLWLLGSALLFALMALGTRELSADIPGPQVALVRFVAGLALVLTMRAAGRTRLRVRYWRWLTMRGGFGGLAVLLYFTCIEKVGAGVATLLNFTSPVWALLFAWLFLGERPPRRVVVALVLTLAGVVLVVGTNRPGGFSLGIWESLGILSAVFGGMAITSVRALRREQASGQAPEDVWTVFLSFSALGALATAPFALPPLGGWVVPDASQWVLLLAVAAVSAGAQVILTLALRHVTAATSGTIHQLTAVLALAGGVLIFDEPLSAAAIIGSAITIAGVVTALRTGGATQAPSRP